MPQSTNLSKNFSPNQSYVSLFVFSAPTILSSVLEPLTGIVDTGLVGHLSTKWLASLAFCTTLFNSLTWIFNFIVHASTQTISASMATTENLLASKVKMCLLVALALGLMSSLGLFIFRPWLYSLVGAKEEFFPLMDDYYLIRISAHSLTLLFITSLSILRGLGQVRVCFFLLLLTTISNIFLSRYFLYTQDLGLSGVAWGSVLSHFLGCALGLLIIYRVPQIRKNIWHTRPPKGQWFHFGRNSLNLFGRSATLTLCFFLATHSAARLGVHSLGAHQILLQIWLFMSFFQDGLATTGNIMGAYFSGQKRTKQAYKIFKKLLHLSGMISLGFTLLYWLGRDPLLKLFTQDSKVLLLCAQIWPLILVSLIISGFAFVYDGILFGLEGFAFLRKHMLLGAVFIALPLMLSSWLWNSLFLLWLGLVLLNVYRALTGFYYLYKSRSIPLYYHPV